MYYSWKPYVSVHQRRMNAQKEMDKLKKKGKNIQPVNVDGRTISKKFWGKKWCDHLDTFADYGNRLPRGKTYVRNGSVCHLHIEKGVCEAIVSGSELYNVTIKIKPLVQNLWDKIKKACHGKIGSILELLQGKLSDQVMKVVADPESGLFPKEKEITFSCSCPDWAGICKHVAAVFYGIGNRLDDNPELLFLMRSVDPSELVSANMAFGPKDAAEHFAREELGSIFDIDIDSIEEDKVSTKTDTPSKKEPKKRKLVSNSAQTLKVDNLKGLDIKKWRERKGLTVSGFAKSLKVTPATVYRWENSTTPIKFQSKMIKPLEKLLQSTDS